MSKHKFQTEVSQLLHLIIHSLYSHGEIFLRELISNSSDALDKIKYLTLTDEQYKSLEFIPQIDISFDDDKKQITISDTGIGMNKDDLKENLGTIGSSDTKKFMEILTGDSPIRLGEFGVGFYSCFMVADKVEEISKKAGENQAYKWTSDGKSGYQIEEAERESFGTDVILHINEEGGKYSNRWEIQNIVKKYSNHISFPVYLNWTSEKKDSINLYDKFLLSEDNDDLPWIIVDKIKRFDNYTGKEVTFYILKQGIVEGFSTTKGVSQAVGFPEEEDMIPERILKKPFHEIAIAAELEKKEIPDPTFSEIKIPTVKNQINVSTQQITSQSFTSSSGSTIEEKVVIRLDAKRLAYLDQYYFNKRKEQTHAKEENRGTSQ